jgi:predicted alpha/beta-hydrolase family hydrolase
VDGDTSADPGEALSITVDEQTRVSARWLLPVKARACCVVAHGAGAGMQHPFMRAVATSFALHDIATLRFQFPYLERGARRPDPPPLCHATLRAAVAEARRRRPRLALFAGGRSFGGRMTSQAQALAPLPGVRALVFLGFPLHPAGKPGTQRAEHLSQVQIPMLFVQGTQDALAEPVLMAQVIERLGTRASVDWIADADHSFHVPARTGRKDAAIREALLAAAAGWLLARA